MASRTLCPRRDVPLITQHVKASLGRLKNEMFYGHLWVGDSLDDFGRDFDGYINWSSRNRIKLSLGGRSPLKYRQHLGFSA